MSRYAVVWVVFGLVLAGVFGAGVCAEEPVAETQEMPSPHFTMPENPAIDNTGAVTLEELRQMVEKSRKNETSAQIRKAWVIGDTAAMLDLAGQMLGKDFPQDILPLPWAKYVQEKYARQWRGAEIVEGGKAWTLIFFPVKYDELSFAEQTELLSDFLDCPLGKYYFPDGKAILFLIDGDFCFVSEDFPGISDAVIKQLADIWDKIYSCCYFGVYHDMTVYGKNAEYPFESDTTIHGYRWGEQGGGYTYVMLDEAKAGTPLAAARTARMACTKPVRTGGFYDEDSAVRLSLRVFPEEAGMREYFFKASTLVLPQDQRNEGGIYTQKFNLGIRIGKRPEDEEAVVRAGDFVSIFTKQQELPWEEDVPSVEEMDAMNRLVHECFRKIIEQIAAKIASGGKDAPVDLCAKVEDRVLYFAVGFAPGEEDRTVDWRLMDTIGRFFNPHHADKSGTWLSIRVDDLHAVQWRGYDFATVELDVGTDIVSIWFRLVLVQGPGILCGAVTPVFANVAYDDMIAGLQKNLEASERIFAAGEPWTVPSVLRVETDEGIVCITGIVSDSAEQKSLLVEMFYNINQTTGMLAGLAKMLTGFMPAYNEL